VFDVGFAGIQHANFFGIGIESSDLVAGFGKTEGEGKADIATTNDGDFQLAAFEKFWSSIRSHEVKKAPNLKEGVDGPQVRGPKRSFNIAVSRESPECGRRMLPEIHDLCRVQPGVADC
jgi:hypothetical protein